MGRARRRDAGGATRAQPAHPIVRAVVPIAARLLRTCAPRRERRPRPGSGCLFCGHGCVPCASTGSRNMNRRSLLGLAAAGALGPLALPRVAGAQSGAWPTRGSIRLVAQFPPGGLVDTVSRLMAPALSQALEPDRGGREPRRRRRRDRHRLRREAAGRWLHAAGQPCLGACLLGGDDADAALQPGHRLHPYGDAGRGLERAAGAQPVALSDAGPVSDGGAHAPGALRVLGHRLGAASAGGDADRGGECAQPRPRALSRLARRRCRT